MQRCEADGTYGECTCGSADAGPVVDAPESIDAPVLVDAPETPDAPVLAPIYAGAVTNISSVWASAPGASGLTGLAAGDSVCQAAGFGADHACDYEEVVLAASAGELSSIAAGTSAWLQRTTTVSVSGTPSAPGSGGNCSNWTFNGNHLADGEYITFDTAGTPTYHFDADTYFDGIDTTHVVPGDLDCGGVMRAILCCFAP